MNVDRGKGGEKGRVARRLEPCPPRDIILCSGFVGKRTRIKWWF